VPTSWPTILEQVESITAVLGRAGLENVNLVVMNGGINDVGVQRIMSSTSDDALEDDIVAACYGGMKRLLEKTAAAFPLACIIVLGYYPVISRESDPHRTGAWAHSLLGRVPFRWQMIRNWNLFTTISDANLQRAIQDVNAALATGPRIRFCSPAFTPEHAVHATDSWLYGLNGDLSPEDPLLGHRAVHCRRSLSFSEICERASVGHPNERGAREYARVIAPQL
jgi:hypothetical protein